MSNLTKINDLLDPIVYENVLRAKIDAKAAVIPFAVVDATLEGNPGSTVTISRFVWDGEAQDVSEGENIPLRALGSETAEYKVKVAALGTSITDMALLNSKGDPIGASAENLAQSLMAKIDDELYNELLSASSVYSPSSGVSYENIVDAIGLFQAEGYIDMVMLCNPDIVTALRKDANFVDKNKYGNEVVMRGEIGMVGNARIVPARRITGVGGYFYSPIILTNDPDHHDDIPAITYFLKRDTNVETFRRALNRTTEITADQVYVVALTNDSKVVILKTTGAKLKFAKMYDEEFTFPNTDVTLETTAITGTTETTRTSDTAWTETLKLSGTAQEISSAQKTGLGIDASATHYITGCIEVPGQTISDTAPAVTWNGSTVPAAEMEKIGACWYLDVVLGLKDSDGSVVPASGATSFTIVCNGITTTVTPDFTNVTLA